MTLYESLAPLYDALFPVDPATAAFLDALADLRADGGPWRLLDAGCATGAQALALAAHGWTAVGIDSETSMIELARQQAIGYGLQSRATFAEGDILGIEARFGGAAATPGDRFGLILCLGNTLPHLAEAGARSFLAQARALLAPGGALVLQTLNYSLPRVGPGFVFPEIAAQGATMRRSYQAAPLGQPGSLRFVVELESGGTTRRGETVLTPLAPRRIEDFLREAGFAAPARYAGWDGRAFDEAADLYCITVARG
jgi:SAM-dependent methyltransferase